MSTDQDFGDDPSATLLRKWQELGERRALDELLRREISILRARLRGQGSAALTRDVSSSDVAQEAALGLIRVREAPSFDHPAALRAYLWRSALRLLAARTTKVDRSTASFDAATTQGLASALATTGGLAAVEDDDRAVALELVLQLIEPHEREILELFYFEQLPLETIGQRLGIAHEAAKKRLARARRALAAELGDWTELIG